MTFAASPAQDHIAKEGDIIIKRDQFATFWAVGPAPCDGFAQGYPVDTYIQKTSYIDAYKENK